MTDTETAPDFVKVKWTPIYWVVQCPSCEENTAVEEIAEDIVGNPCPAPEAQFIKCECGLNIEVVTE